MTFRVGTGELAIEIGLGVSVEVDSVALAPAHHSHLVPATGLNFDAAGQHTSALVSC